MKKAELIKSIVKRKGPPTSFGTDPKNPWAAKSNVTEETLDEWKQSGALMRFLKSKGMDPRYVTKDTMISHSKSGEFAKWKQDHMLEEVDEKDTITFDIPLIIRMLELAREDLKSDADLHRVVEKLIEIRNKGVLTMDDYDYVSNLKEGLEVTDDMRDMLDEDLRKWFKQKWVRMDTKGNIKGDCARDPGEGKPKCLPMSRAHALGKEGRAAAARRKRREDPNPERKGSPINVRTEEIEQLDEKNKPTSPEKWARAKAAAKSKFAVYPSAYANAWAAKKYKSMGGGWRSVSEESDIVESHVAIAMGKELDDEGSMAMNQLDSITRSCEMLRKEINNPEMQLPAWVQSKLTLAADYMETVAGYMASKNEKVNEEVEQIAEGGIETPRRKFVGEPEPGSYAYERKYGKYTAKGTLRKRPNPNKPPVKEPVAEDKFQDPYAATQTVGMEIDTDSVPKKKREMTKSARIIKSIYKKKNVKEELYDHEKEKKTPSLGKKPKVSEVTAEMGKVPQAAVVMSGGKTMTGETRDTIEIDPMMKFKVGVSDKSGQVDPTKR